MEAGSAASGWPDQCWTLARIREVVRRRFGVEYTLAGLDLLLHRIGWSVQVPARKATERDEAGQGLRPPKGRTWGRRGHTPVV
ncbi:winged helix-turn-helix domain-containing protein [Streptomyces sp. Act143]|uniref:helix-turn-helix domain-containing protein n=1 Tax=Streptomyces sp. Act143 TaxID=2200760 RepID=UPI00215AE1A8|nr:winged helix-turn-helix domain-containing protein [Streptomyces sp. Act143]